MGIQAQRYLRKPLYVDAVRITSANFEEISAWCQGEILRDEESGSGKKYIKVRVHNPKNPRQTKAFVGDWLLYTERGYKVYTSKAFHAAFDRVDPGPTEPLSDERLTGDPVVDVNAEAVNNKTYNSEVARLKNEAGIDPIEHPIELIPATPETIADAVRSNEQARAQENSQGKRVLTQAEQDELGSDEVRELVQSGEVVLAQDIAQP